VIRRLWPVLGLLAASAIQVACSGSDSPGLDYKPATVEQVEGTDVSRVILTAIAAERIGIQVQPVREEPASAALHGTRTGNMLIPTASLLYDTAGGVWVYVAIPDPGDAAGLPLTYQRHEVVVARIQGDLAVLSSGPAPGTPVVIVGAAELFGAENGVEGE
jgi:hypothetical protein